MNSLQIIDTYEAIQRITGKMLLAAQNSEWELLITLEKECSKLTKQLIQNNSSPKLTDKLLHKKEKIIHQILEDDLKIKSITQLWMKKLNDTLSTTERKRDLHRAYQLD